MKEKIKAIVAQLVALGMPEDRAWGLIQRILDAPPTDEEIKEAFTLSEKP